MARRKTPTVLERGLAQQAVAVNAFQTVVSSLDVSDDLLSRHQEAVDAEIARLQNESNTVTTAMERNARVRAKMQELTGS